MIQRPRLLVVDDDPDFRRLVSHTLRRHFFVVEAKDGCEGYSRALSVTPDIILLDMHMEGWSGLETLKKFRELPRMAYLPIVMLTSDSQRETVVQAIQAGASDYVLKTGLNQAELVTRLMHLIPTKVEA